jgi:hypothetical protein
MRGIIGRYTYLDAITFHDPNPSLLHPPAEDTFDNSIIVALDLQGPTPNDLGYDTFQFD